MVAEPACSTNQYKITATEHDIKPLSPASCPHKPKIHLNVTL